MMRVHAPEKNCCRSRQPDSGRFAPRGFANRAEDKETVGEHKPLPLDFDMTRLPLYPPVQAKFSGGSAGDGRENKDAASLEGTGEKAPAAGQVQPEADRQEPNRTGMPDRLKAGIEALSGIDMSDVLVHYSSPRPAKLNALAYTQGNQIHIASGQERHLAHEAWHAVQQAQGRVKPTVQKSTGSSVNDDQGLESEADTMGAQAMQATNGDQAARRSTSLQRKKPAMTPCRSVSGIAATFQRKVGFEYEMTDIETRRHSIIGDGSHPHSKGYVLRSMPGYQLTADVVANGGSQLELIFKAIDEADPMAVGNLIIGTAPAAVAAVKAIANLAQPNWTRADAIVGVGGSHFDEYRFMGNGAANIFGQLQMTAGIDPVKLLPHLSGQQATNYLATIAPLGAGNPDDDLVRDTLAPYEAMAGGVGLTVGPHAIHAVNGIVALNVLTQPERNHLAGIAALMATIPYTARRPVLLPYAKSAAGAHLARTDFARMMVKLSDATKGVLTTPDMQRIVLDTINNVLLPPVPVQVADPVFPAGSVGGGAPPLNVLSIGDWVAGVMPVPRPWLGGHKKGRDQLTKKHFPGNQAMRDQMESLGGYGNKLDPGDFPILEFRTLTNVPLPNLTEQLRRLIAFINH